MKKIISFAGMAAILSLFACNKESNEGLNGAAYTNDPGIRTGTPKVLYLVIDGARGESVRSLKPPALWQMRDSAVFSWAGISDSTGAEGTTWADLLTGVTSEKHGVTGDDYTNIKTADYPVFFKRLKDAGAVSRSAAFVTNPEVSRYLLEGNVDVNKTFTADADVKAAIISELQNDSTAVVLGEFNEVQAAGKQFGYDASIPEYAAAIIKADQAVGEIVAALRARKNYSKENWLVIVTSNHGGLWPVPPDENDNTPFTKPLRNTFTLFFNPRFESQVVARPDNIRLAYEGKAARLFGNESNYVRAECDDQGLLDIKKGAITVEMKIKKNRSSKNNYEFSNPPFFGKCANRTGSTPGWAFFHNGKTVVFFVGDGSTNQQLKGGKDIADGDWHTLTGTVQLTGTTYEISFFIDGENKVTQRIVGSAVATTTGIVSPAKTILGYFPTVFGSDYIDFYPSDVRVFNTVVSDETIKAWAPKTAVTKQHPNYKNLLAWWSCLDGSGAKFRDTNISKKDFDLKGAYTWKDFSDLSGFLYPAIPDQERYVPNSADIPLVIMDWMKVPVQTAWSLDGKSWPATYRDFPVSVSK